jgi:tetratricopeptide (TPR) repeat protein
MSDQANQELIAIRRQLVQIKWVSLTITLGLLAIVGLAFQANFSSSSYTDESDHAYNPSDDFSELKKLLNEQEFLKLYSQSKMRISVYPKQWQGYYYAGVAAYQLQKNEEAINYLKKAESMNPPLKTSHTGPYILKAKEALSK